VELTHTPGSVSAFAAVTIRLGLQSLTGSSNLPASLREQRNVEAYLVLLRVEFTLLRTVTRRTVRSYRTLSPLPDPFRAIGGFLSAALVVGSRPPGVTWHPALWSPDVPPLCQSPEGRQRQYPKRTSTSVSRRTSTEQRLPSQLRGRIV